MTVRAPLWQDPATPGAPFRQMSAVAGDTLDPALIGRSICFGTAGVLSAALSVPLGPVPLALTLNTAGSYLSALTGPSAAVTDKIYNGAGTQVGSVVWSANGRVGTVTLTWSYAKNEQGYILLAADTQRAGVSGYFGQG